MKAAELDDQTMNLLMNVEKWPSKEIQIDLDDLSRFVATMEDEDA